MPLAVLLVLLYSIYSSKPVGVIDSLTVSSVFIFLVMVWIGATACDMENAVSEQILILRMQSAVKYYISHTVFLFLMGILFPVIMDLCSQGQLFDRPLRIADLLWGFFIMSLSGFSGSSLGEISHPRINRSRKTAVIFTFLLAVTAVTKAAILEMIPVLAVILWVIPPISDVTALFAGETYFSADKCSTAFIILLISGMIWTAVKIMGLKKKGF